MSEMHPAWINLTAAAERLGCSVTYLREVMDATPPDIDRPWVMKGTGKGRSARYSWEVARMDRWWRELHERRLAERQPPRPRVAPDRKSSSELFPAKNYRSLVTLQPPPRYVSQPESEPEVPKGRTRIKRRPGTLGRE